ncbi:hypothetical protein LTR53_009504 [Teratosphaeriaceae sp. CCFEE 6253]|nr:hypothetical protein LTR53_009504 [Teratosphaeriaceae sp. CCFEE 6253]
MQPAPPRQAAPLPATESTPLLESKANGNTMISGTINSYGTTKRPAPPSGRASNSTSPRPALIRSATTMTAAAVQTTSPTATTPTPVMSRPIATRSAADLTAAARAALSRTSTTAPPTRPSLLRRATDLLDLNPTTSYTHRNAPDTPSHWTDHAHRSALLAIWDTVHAAAPTAKSLIAQVVETEKRMLLCYAELGEGEAPLARSWVEYVLGVSLRQPFCTAERMGRYEMLAGSAGGRLNWGPW